MLQFKNDQLVVTNELLLKQKLNSCQIKHYNKLNYSDFTKIYVEFSETPRYILEQLKVVYWKYFEHSEIDKFIKFTDNVLIEKQKDNTQTFKQILNKLTKYF